MVKRRLSSEPEISSQETYFEEREGDDEALWAVTEIIAERGNKYRVLWEGINPDTNKPWDPSWVPRSDCTDPLVEAWKLKKAAKKKNAGRRSTIKSRTSIVSNVSKKSSISSNAITTRASTSRKTTSGSKRKQSERETSKSPGSQSPEIDTLTSVRPTKRRKLNVEVVMSPPTSKSKGKGRMVFPKMEEEEDNFIPVSHKTKADTNAVYLKEEEGEGEEEADNEVEDEGKDDSMDVSKKVDNDSVMSVSYSEPETPPHKKLVKGVSKNAILSTADKNTIRDLKPTSSERKITNGHVSSISPPSKKRRRPKSTKVARLRTHSPLPSPEPTITNSFILPPKSPPTSHSKLPPPKAYTSKHNTHSRDDDSDGGLEYANSPAYQCQPASFPAASPRSTESPLFLPEKSPTPRHQGLLLVPKSATENPQFSSPNINGSHSPTRTPSPSKTSIKNRMKPRTPGSKRTFLDPDIVQSPPSPLNRDADIKSRTFKKQLFPIPQISPSKFKDHLTSSLEQPSSTIETVEHVDSNESSIEEFDSPVKRKSTFGSSQMEPELTSSIPSSAATNIMTKGIQMAEAARRNKQTEKAKDATKPTLGAIISKEKEKGKARATISSQSEDGDVPHPNLEEFADSFLDYEGGLNEFSQTENTNELGNAQDPPKLYLPQEEEESTQELLAELAPRQHSVPVDAESLAQPTTNMVVDSQDSLNEGVSMEVVAPKSSIPMESHFESSQPIIELEVRQPPSRSKSSRRSISVEIPATISPSRHVSAELSPLPTQDAPHHLESAMNLLNKKSDEINRLESLLAAAQATIQQLQVDNATLQIQAGSTTYTSFSNETNEEKESLLVAVETAKKKQELAEKDVEFFREQWARASAFVSEVQDENKVLLQRAEIAESQVTMGLEGMRNMFDSRIQQLEKELRYHKRVADFVMKQSQKTGEDEIRRKAAEYPELERKYKDLEDMLEGARGMIDLFEKQISARDHDLGVKRRENAEVKEELDKAKKDIERIERELEIVRRELSERDGDNSYDEPQHKVNGEVEVYRCQWRKDGKDQCDAMFLAREDLERHITSEIHLQ